MDHKTLKRILDCIIGIMELIGLLLAIVWPLLLLAMFMNMNP